MTHPADKRDATPCASSPPPSDTPLAGFFSAADACLKRTKNQTFAYIVPVADTPLLRVTTAIVSHHNGTLQSYTASAPDTRFVGLCRHVFVGVRVPDGLVTETALNDYARTHLAVCAARSGVTHRATTVLLSPTSFVHAHSNTPRQLIKYRKTHAL